MRPMRDDLYCFECGGTRFAFVGTYANGCAWECKQCGRETMRDEDDGTTEPQTTVTGAP
jgi:hypothetical protein